MRRYIDYILGIFIFLSAAFYIPGQNFHDSQSILFKIFAFSAVISSLYITPLRNIKNNWVNSFLPIAFLSFLFNPLSRTVAIEPLVNITLVILLFYIFLNHMEDTNIVYSAIMGVVLVNLAMVIFQFFKIDPLCLDDQRRQNSHLVGLFGHPMNLGAYMAVVLPYLIYKNKWLAIMAAILLLASGSWAAVLCGIVGTGIYFWLKNKKIFYIVLAIVSIVCLIGAVYISQMDSIERQEIYKKVTLRIYTQWPTVKVMITRPYFGHGPGTFKYIMPQIKEIDVGWLGGLDVTWNDYLGCGLEMGIGACLIMFGLIRNTYRRFLNNKSPEVTAIFCSLATIPIGVFFHSYMNYMNISIVCLAMYVMYEIKLFENKNEI